MAAQAKAKKEAPGPESFEKSLSRLEEIVAEMEDGSLGLEKMIARFEEGRALLKFCSDKLNEVDRKIEVLVQEGEAVTTKPFDEGSEAGSEPDDMLL